MPAKKAFTVLILMFVFLLPIKDSIAAPIIENNFAQDEPPVTEISTGVAAKTDLNQSGISSLSGSKVTFDPTAGGYSCYNATTPQTLCFKSETFTSDWEYVYNNWMRFPPDWVVSNVYVQGTPVCDSGSWGTFNWSFQTSPYEVKINHPRYQSSTDHCVASYCVEVTPLGIADPAQVSWYFDGDGYGAEPHNPCSSDIYTPSGQSACDEMVNPAAAVPSCGPVPHVVVSPPEIQTSGCHAEAQFKVLTLSNYTGSEATFDITYDKDFPGEFYGPAQITLANSATTDFDVILDPHLCSYDADYTATVTVTDGTNSDQSTIYYEVYSELHEWQSVETSPNPRMDNVLAGYDDKVWNIVGYGGSGEVNYYDPNLNTWTTIPASTPPWGSSSYPRSGCQMENEVFVYGDANTPGFTGLWSYNMDTNAWTSETPGGAPPSLTGIWAPSWVGDSNYGLCYLTGGATTPGGGDLATVYVYDVIANAWLTPLPNFTSTRDFHAAFLFTRPSDSHRLLCVGGGADATSAGMSSTQCYDFMTGIWNAENADMGALPGGLWGMGFTSRFEPAGGKLWMVGGVYNTTLTNQTWFYDVNTGTWMDGGPLESAPVYRTAAVTLGDTVYHVGGSIGSFDPTGISNKRVDVVCPECIVPDMTKEATEIALPDQTIHYNITLDSMVSDTALVYDFLPDLVEYVPGSLTITPEIGEYGYDTISKSVWWYIGSVMANTNGWTPAMNSGTATSPVIKSLGEAPLAPIRPELINYSIESVLWNQPLSTVSQGPIMDQDFPDFSLWSSFLADDFEVTTPWLIDTFFVPGGGYNGFTTLFNATNLTFMIYADDHGMPAGDPSGGGALPVWADS